MNPSSSLQAYRGHLFYFPTHASFTENLDPIWIDDGLLLVQNGLVYAVDHYDILAPTLNPETLVHDYRGKIIMPGFIDSHLHYPQTDMIASPAPDLLPWLENYTFPTEMQFSNEAHAHDVSAFFLEELMRNGTTTAMVYGSVHKTSVDAFFEQSHARNMRMIAGKVLMDRNCPASLRDTAITGAQDSADLIEKWHNYGRQLYAITPRFAPTSTHEQLKSCTELARQYADVFIQTHVAESQAEVAWVKKLFPSNKSYLSIYDEYELLRPRAVYGHAIYLEEHDWQRLTQSGACIAHCPTSNLFLGSGLFDTNMAKQYQTPFSLATDVGAGTSFSMLRTMAAAYQVARLKGYYLTAFDLFYLCTAGAAKQLGLEKNIGTLEVGTEADFIVINDNATPLMERRCQLSQSLEERLFSLITLGDDRCIAATYIAGNYLPSRKDFNLSARLG